jgi:hypothetical protein
MPTPEATLDVHLYGTCSDPSEGAAGCLGGAAHVTAVTGEGLDDALLTGLVSDIRAGMRRADAAARRHIPPTTLGSWLRKGWEQIDLHTAGKLDALTIYGRLVLLVAEAEGEHRHAGEQRIRAAGDPKLELALLRARYPQHYTHTSKIVTPPDIGNEAPPPVKVRGRDVLAAKLDQLDRARQDVELAVEAGDGEE